MTDSSHRRLSRPGSQFAPEHGARTVAFGAKLKATVACMLVLAACEPAATPAPPAETALADPGNARWTISSRGEDDYATVVNASGYELAIGCTAIGETGRYMEVRQGGAVVGNPPEYGFTVSSGSGPAYQGTAALLQALPDSGSTRSYAALEIDAIDALRKGRTVDVSIPGAGAQRFGLSGSLKAIDATAC